MRLNRSLAVIAVLAALMLGSCMGRNPKARSVSDSASSGTTFELSDSLLSLGHTDTLSFGRVREGERVVREFTLRNTGRTPFVITNITLNCNCITFEFNRDPIAPGGEKKLSAFFDSAGYYGEVIKKASVLTSLSGKTYNIYLEAIVE